ncbi:phage tail sheath subtilisin-like domain-containing protein [Shewanella xiamenensis]|uniref:phage tail sheath subtilisin-like domain-containing protein n=1 Tax=Shewanella xiamenensis TaxID=332186 RepID=UPI000849B5B6|nr:phage tail sheath subtilisin-like domain-containing protein [Shewanella xiamenensis]ODR86708.1 hypothetical protein ABT47_16050 [Shewanella xiamenensis]
MSVNAIPPNIRVPLVYIAIDNSAATTGSAALQRKLFVTGQMLASGTANPSELHRITSPEQGRALFGAGSMLDSMLTLIKKANPYAECVAVALADNPAGQKATAVDAIKLTGEATQSGTLALLIGGVPVNVAVPAKATAAAVATSLIATINAAPLPVSAVAGAAGSVTLTSRFAGETGNDIAVLLNYYTGQATPEGLNVTLKPLTGGTANPDITEAISVMGDTWYTDIVMPYTDTLNLNILRDELIARWGPVKMAEAIAYTALRGTLAQASAHGNARNDFLLSCMSANLSPQPAYAWAASYAAVANLHLGIDPARPLQTLILPGILAPLPSQRWDFNERNLLLYDGMATHTVDAAGNVLIEREISMYQTNAFGDTDISYLDITTPATLGYIRYATKARIQSRWPRHKLADDGTRFDPSQPIVTPSIIRTELLNLFIQFEQQGLVEHFDDYKDSLLVWRDKDDRNAVNVESHPDLVNQFRKLAMGIQFVL